MNGLTTSGPREASNLSAMITGQESSSPSAPFNNLPFPVKPVLIIHPTPMKSRVETQIPIKMTLFPLPPGITKLHFPTHTISKSKLLAKPTHERSPDTVELHITLVCTSSMQNPDHRRRAFQRAADTASSRSGGSGENEEEEDDENKPLNGGDVKICAGCITRERKRAARKKVRKVEEEESWHKDEAKRVIVFNTHEVKEWQVPTSQPGDLPEPFVPEGAMQIDAPMRIACYCRHQNEKLGFQVIFTIKDYQDHLIAQEITSSIMITDDHKTHNVPAFSTRTSSGSDGQMYVGSGAFCSDGTYDEQVRYESTKDAWYSQSLQGLPRRGSFGTSEGPKLQRTFSSGSIDSTTRKMHYSMGSDYGGSEDEGPIRSRHINRSRSSSRQTSHSRNRRHSDAYTPSNQAYFVDVSDIMVSSSSFEQCVSCQEYLRIKMLISVTCHYYCGPCLSLLVQRALASEKLWPPKCCSNEIPTETLLRHLNQGTKDTYNLALKERTRQVLDCPNCSGSFADVPLLLQHHEESHLTSNPLPNGNEEGSKRAGAPDAQIIPSNDSNSDGSTQANSQGESRETKPPGPVLESESDDEVTPSTPLSTLSDSLQKPTPQKISLYQGSLINASLLGKATLRFLGLQTTAWFVLVLATACTAIATTFSVQQPQPEHPPEIGDSNYYASLSQSVIAICSLYYMLVPFLRGSEQLPVRVLFYVCWILGLVGAVACPLVYGRDWRQSVWCGFGGALAQVAATAFLFENVRGRRGDREREKERVCKTKRDSEVRKGKKVVEEDTEEVRSLSQ